MLLLPFRGSPTPEGYDGAGPCLRLDGYDNKTIRAHMVEMTKVQSNQDFEILMKTPYGPNGQSIPRAVSTGSG